jgi:cytochrome c oxidase subunit 2
VEEESTPAKPKVTAPAATSTVRQGGPNVYHRDHRRWRRIEWAWTLIPVFLLVSVAVLSVGLLYAEDSGPINGTANMHVTVIGHQWFWQFNYTDPFGSNLTNGTGASSTNGILYVPQNAVVDLTVTAADVIHTFNVPQLGVRIDAIPGRLNHYWLTIPAGTADYTRFLIQCTEYCGVGHPAMRAWIVVVPCNANLGAC